MNYPPSREGRWLMSGMWWRGSGLPPVRGPRGPRRSPPSPHLKPRLSLRGLSPGGDRVGTQHRSGDAGVYPRDTGRPRHPLFPPMSQEAFSGRSEMGTDSGDGRRSVRGTSDRGACSLRSSLDPSLPCGLAPALQSEGSRGGRSEEEDSREEWRLRPDQADQRLPPPLEGDVPEVDRIRVGAAVRAGLVQPGTRADRRRQVIQAQASASEARARVEHRQADGHDEERALLHEERGQHQRQGRE